MHILLQSLSSPSNIQEKGHPIFQKGIYMEFMLTTSFQDNKLKQRHFNGRLTFITYYLLAYCFIYIHEKIYPIYSFFLLVFLCF